MEKSSLTQILIDLGGLFDDINLKNNVAIVIPRFSTICGRGVSRSFELRVLTVIDCPKIVGAKGLTVIDFPILRVLKHPYHPC